jgi:hypothetical protein
MTDGTTGGSAERAVTGNMPSNAADDGALDATLGLSGGCQREQRSRNRYACKALLHRFVSPSLKMVIKHHR